MRVDSARMARAITMPGVDLGISALLCLELTTHLW